MNESSGGKDSQFHDSVQKFSDLIGLQPCYSYSSLIFSIQKECLFINVGYSEGYYGVKMMFGKMCKMFMDLPLLYAHVTMNYSVKWFYNYMLKESTKLILELNYSVCYSDFFYYSLCHLFDKFVVQREKKRKKRQGAKPITLLGKYYYFPTRMEAKNPCPSVLIY